MSPQLGDLQSYLHFLSNCQSTEVLWKAHVARMAAYGFDRLIYGYTRYISRDSLGDPADFVLLSNHDKAYTDVFIGEKHYLRAPMLSWALSNEGPCSWGVLHQASEMENLTEAQERFLKFNAKMEVTAGYTISFCSATSRSKGAIALTAKRGMTQEEVDAMWAEHGDDILLMNNIAHLKILSLPHSAPSRRLTDRQREVLEWVGDGKTTQDTALLMGLKPATIEKHLRLARERLDVSTTAQAVLKAALSNQIWL